MEHYIFSENMTVEFMAYAGIVIAFLLLILVITRLIQQYKQTGIFLSIVILFGVGAFIYYFSSNKINEFTAKTCVDRYIDFFYSDNGKYRIGSPFSKQSYLYDDLSDFYPQEYISKSVCNVDSFVNSYKTLQYGEFDYKKNFINEISYIEKCNADEIEKDLAINYGVKLNISCAYRVYVYYDITNSYDHSLKYTKTIPIICGKVEGKWFILDDFNDYGMLETVRAINTRTDLFEQNNLSFPPKSDNDAFDDRTLTNKASITDAIGSFVDDSIGKLSDEEKQLVEDYLITKYEETGVRMYIVFSDSDDNNYITNYIDDNLLGAAQSPSMAFCRSASDNKWFVRWKVPEKHGEVLANNYEQIGNAYLISGSCYDRVINVIDKAYEIYGE